MKRPATSFETTVRAFRDLTATPVDGAATRARVLARADRHTDRRVTFRRTALAIAAGLVALSSASAAFTTGARLWRAPAPITLTMGSTPGSVLGGGRARRVIPFATDEAVASTDATSTEADAEARAYGRAHRAHFVDDAPSRALAAWDEYLEAYPHGILAPEARYNRILCLVRLGRFGEAARDLRPFARGILGGYRQTEARLLLDWIHERLDADRNARGPSLVP